VVGRLKQDRWVGNDGKNHTRVAIVAEHVEYRPDFKKAGETAPERGVSLADDEAGILAEQASQGSIGMYERQMEDSRIQELQAVAF